MYTFRIKSESKFEQLVRYVLSDNADVSQAHLKKMGYTWNDIYALFRMGHYSDNFTLSHSGGTYTEVVPQQTVIHEAANVEVTGGGVAQPDRDDPTVRWPDTPVVGDGLSYFRKPRWYDRMGAMVKAGKHISLAGPPGIGKSTAVEQLAADCGKPLVNVSADAGLRRRDLTGNVELVNSHTQFQVAEYVAAAVNGWWAKIDEVNAAEPDALMYLNSQIAPPFTVNFYGTSMPIHPDFRLFVTYNPGLVGTKPLPESLKDRFFPIKLAFPNESGLRALLEANGMPEGEGWMDTVVKFGLKAWQRHEMGRMRYQITPRRLMDASLLVQVAGENVYNALEQAVIAAVDNMAEVRVLKEVLKSVKDEATYGRSM